MYFILCICNCMFDFVKAQLCWCSFLLILYVSNLHRFNFDFLCTFNFDFLCTFRFPMYMYRIFMYVIVITYMPWLDCIVCHSSTVLVLIFTDFMFPTYTNLISISCVHLILISCVHFDFLCTCIEFSCMYL